MPNSKRKGNAFELKIVNFLNKEYGSKAFRRVPLSGGFEKTEYPGDLFPIDDFVKQHFNLVIECKSYKTIDLPGLLYNNSIIFKWLNQAIEDSEIYKSAKNKHLRPMVVMKQNNRVPLMVTPMDWYPNDHIDVGTIESSYNHMIFRMEPRNALEWGKSEDIHETSINILKKGIILTEAEPILKHIIFNIRKRLNESSNNR